MQSGDVAAANTGTMLYLDRYQPPARVENQVTLRALRCSPEVGVPRQTKMPKQLPHLHRDEGFKELTEMRSPQKPMGITDSLQVERKANVGKHPFRPADEPLCRRDMVGRQGQDLIARLQERKPMVHRFMIHTQDAADFSLVQYGARAAGAERQEAVKPAEITNLAQLSYVPL